MPNSPASVGFNLPFDEAIAAMEARGVVLPEKYYGELQGIHRQLNFSIAGVASLDQLQGVLDSLTAKLADGQSFKQWQDSVAVQDLGLPKHRLDNIFRTNIQNAYNRGHWEQFKENEKFAPYLMYDAINDSRTRPSHRALNGIIRLVSDPFWDTHYPANGYRCRCSVVSLSEKQAQARSKGGNGLNKSIDVEKMKPDKGWDYNCGEDITTGIDKAVADRKANPDIHDKLKAALSEKLAVSDFVPSSTPKAAAKFLIENDIVNHADFGKITDMQVINDWNKALFETIKAYPELREAQKFTGSIQARNKILYEHQLNDYVEKLKVANAGRNVSDKAMLDYAKKHVKKLTINDNCLAVSNRSSLVGGVSLNEKMTTGSSLKNLNARILNDVKTSYHPAGCDSLKSFADHELGHQLDNLLKISEQKEVIALFEQLTNDNLIKSEVSKYAETDIGEFIAECWAEYKNNPTPRGISERIGRIIDDAYSRL